MCTEKYALRTWNIGLPRQASVEKTVHGEETYWLFGKEKFRVQWSAKKFILIVYWYMKEPITIDFIEKSATINYCQLFVQNLPYIILIYIVGLFFWGATQYVSALFSRISYNIWGAWSPKLLWGRGRGTVYLVYCSKGSLSSHIRRPIHTIQYRQSFFLLNAASIKIPHLLREESLT